MEMPFKQWNVETLRLTAFNSQASESGDISWWGDLVGVEPESSLSRKRDNILQEQGPFHGGTLHLIRQPFRVDWTLVAPVEDEDSLFPALLPDATYKFYELGKKWLALKTCPELNRLAFGPILGQAVQTRQLGYEKLASYLLSLTLDPGAQDFFYQINRPRDSRSGIPSLRINRLCKWSVSLKSKVSVVMGTAPQVSSEGGQLAAQLELDINTSEGYKGFFGDTQRLEVFQELIDLAVEISEKGDVP
jgi:hypothetical protein